MSGVLQIEHGSDTDGSEVSHEERFLPVLADSRHEFVRNQDGWDAAEDHDQKAKREKARVCDAGCIWLVELVPRENRADVHEPTEVEENIDTRVDFVMALLCFAEVCSVPVQGVTSKEASQEIVRP